MSTSYTLKHAIVIGGGIAGLLAARVLSEHFERVTLIEKDHYPGKPISRPGTPQARHVHTMLLRGQHILEGLFPGLESQLLAAGAVQRYYGHESLYYYGGRCPRIPPILRGWNCSRPLLEWQIRQFLATYPNLHIIEGYEVTGLLFEEQTSSVYGIQFQERGDRHNPALDKMGRLEGNLVVDASGSSSQSIQWLEKIGYESPPEIVVNSFLGYATCTYVPPANRPEWKGIAIQSTGPLRRGGSLMEVENDRWMVVLAGAGKENYPSTKPEEYLTFAQNLPEQALYEAIKEATPVTQIYGYRRTENRLRCLERLKRWPAGFIVIGDAVCTFNPIYGQGMTVSAEEALLLDTCLRSMKQRRNFAHDFQKKLSRILTFPWQLATSSDRRVAEEHRTKKFSERFADSLIALLPKDQEVLLTFLEVVHMIRSPFALAHPTILAKVFAQMNRQLASEKGVLRDGIDKTRRETPA